MATSPTQRTLKMLKDAGYKGAIVERWLPNPAYPGGGKRLDYMNIIDIISIKGASTLGVQSCGAAFSEHHRKLTEELPEKCTDWLEGGTRRLFLVGWRKVKGRLKSGAYSKAMRWKPRIREYFLEGKELKWKDK